MGAGHGEPRVLKNLKAVGETYMPRAFALASTLADWRVARNPMSDVNLLPLLASTDELACDIGANRGLFSFWMLHLGLRVAAFEPNPHMVPILRYRFPRALRQGRLRIFDIALSDSDGDAVLHVPKGFSPLGTIDGGLIGRDLAMDEIVVARRRLDDCIEEPTGFIKIDVEGHEHRVLEGARRLLMQSRPSILVEAEERHHAGAVADMQQMLHPMGYEGFFVDTNGLRPISEFDPNVHQRLDALNAEGTAALPGHRYVNNFVFVARPQVIERLHAWRPHRALTGI